jgi:hypothetical protein
VQSGFLVCDSAWFWAVRCNGDAVDFCSGCTRLECWPGLPMSWLRFYVVFLGTSWKWQDSTLFSVRPLPSQSLPLNHWPVMLPLAIQFELLTAPCNKARERHRALQVAASISKNMLPPFSWPKFDPEDGGSIFLRIVCMYLPDYTMLHPRRQ